MDDFYDFDKLKHDAKKEEKNKKKFHDLIEEIDSFNDDIYFPKEETKTTDSYSYLSLKERDKKLKEEEESDIWFNQMISNMSPSIFQKTSSYSGFDDTGIIGHKKKKKKKKKEKNELIDYKKELEPEMALFKNLLVDQSRFTDSLQKEYDSIKSSKGSSRGFTKQLTDLIKNITEARALSMQLVEKQVNAKKLISELTMKQQKELNALGVGEDGLADYGANFLRKMIQDRASLIDTNYDGEISEYTNDELQNEILNLDNTLEERPDEVNKYLQYENRNIRVYVIIRNNDVENYEFVAKDENGEIVPDYPLPLRTKLSVNYSTNIATDEYGSKYFMILE